MTADEIKLMNADQEQYRRTGFGRWSWYAVFEKLSNGDLTKFDAIGEQTYIGCLNLLSYWKERDQEIKRLQDQIKK